MPLDSSEIDPDYLTWLQRGCAIDYSRPHEPIELAVGSSICLDIQAQILQSTKRRGYTATDNCATDLTRHLGLNERTTNGHPKGEAKETAQTRSR